MSEEPMWVTLMSCLADSLAQTSQLQVNEQALPQKHEADYGLSFYALSGKLDRESLCWKTSQLSMFPQETQAEMSNQAPLLSWLLHSPKWAMMLSGYLYELPILAHPTSAKDGSAWPTTTVSNAKGASQGEIALGNPKRRLVTEVAVQELQWPTPRANGLIGGSGSREMQHFAAQDGGDSEELLQMASLTSWKTPVSNDSKKGANHTPKLRQGLVSQVKLVQSSEAQLLNPDWLECLMGLPIGWTDIKANGLSAQTKNNSPTNQGV